MKQSIIVLILPLFLYHCQPARTQEEASSEEFIRNVEAREDSLEMVKALEARLKVKEAVFPNAETEPVGEGALEDAADDPAFWYNQAQPEQSVVFGTNKKGGIYAYNLTGDEKTYYQVGAINNIDTRQGVKIGSDTYDILAGSNRTDNSIILFSINGEGELKKLLKENHRLDKLEIDEVYGLCLYKDAEGEGYVIANGKNGRINMYRIAAEKDSCYLLPHRSWKLKSQPEGMVADDIYGVLYIGEEQRGIWRTDLKTEGSEVELIPSSQRENNPFITYDIEGLSIYYGENGDGFLLASIQGSFTYAIFDRQGDNAYLSSFRIDEGPEVDAVYETDGLDIFSGPIGDLYPQGLLIVQDGFNYDGQQLQSQNFKYIGLDQVLSLRQ